MFKLKVGLGVIYDQHTHRGKLAHWLGTKPRFDKLKKGEKAVKTRAYARIVDIFEHRMYPHRESPARVIIECKWYEEVGINPVNGLPMIRLNENWEVARYAFLDTCVAADVVYWPTDPFDAECETMDVIRH